MSRKIKKEKFMKEKNSKVFDLQDFPKDDFISMVIKDIVESVWVFNLDTMKFDWIENGHKIHGVIPATMADNENLFLGERIFPDHRPILRDLLIEAREKAIRTRNNVKVEEFFTKHLHVNGDYIPTSVKLTLYCVNGMPKYIFGVTRKIDHDNEIDKQKEKMIKKIKELEGKLNAYMLDKLSKREKECYRLIRDGMSRKKILKVMKIHENTLYTYIRRINTKLDIQLDI